MPLLCQFLPNVGAVGDRESRAPTRSYKITGVRAQDDKQTVPRAGITALFCRSSLSERRANSSVIARCLTSGCHWRWKGRQQSLCEDLFNIDCNLSVSIFLLLLLLMLQSQFNSDAVANAAALKNRQTQPPGTALVHGPWLGRSWHHLIDQSVSQ